MSTALLRHRLLLFLCVLVAMGLGLAYTLFTKPVYEAVSVVRFEVEQLDLPQLVQVQYSENLISTEIEMLRGRSAAEAVVDSLGLRAHLLSPRRKRASELFSTLRVSPTADSVTLVFQARNRRPDSTFTVSRPDSPGNIGLARIGDTTTMMGVLLTLTPAVQNLTSVRLRIDPRDDAILRFRSALAVKRPARDADLIAIHTRAAEPAQAAAMANLMARNLIADRQEARRGRTVAAVAFLKQQEDSLGRQLRAAEERLRAYQEREHVMDVPEQSRAQVTRFAQLQADIAGIRAERDAFATLVAQMRQDTTAESLGGQAPSRRLMAFPSLLRNQSASVLLGALAQVEAERSQLLVRRMPADSDVQVLTRRIREIETQLQGIAESFLQSLSNQVASLQGEAGRFGAQLDALPEKEMQVARRERDSRVLTDLSVLVHTRLKEAEITGAAGDPTVRLVDPAAPPAGPIRPRPFINLVLSLLIGSMVGVLAALALELGNRSVRSRADALSATGLPVLGALPKVQKRSTFPSLRRSRRRRRKARRPTPVLAGLSVLAGFSESKDPPGAESNAAASRIASLLVTRKAVPVEYAESFNAYAEAFNQLHMNLAIAFREQPFKVLVITSPLPGEGKTLTAVNFALTVASRGLRVLLIDADVRCGLVSDVFRCSREPGFAELLDGTAEFEEVARRIRVGDDVGLVIVPSGELFPTSGRLQGMAQVREVLETLAPQFDLILIDTPPTNLLADAALLGSAADAVLLVVRAGHTATEAVRFAMDRLTAARAPVIGTLLNDIDLRRHAYDDGSYRYLAEVEQYYARRR